MSLFRNRTTFTQDQDRNLRKAGDFRRNRADHPPVSDSGVTVTTHDNDIRTLVVGYRKKAGRDQTNRNAGLHREVAENGGDDEGAEVFGGCDAIAMTTQGYSGPQPWVGSVAERVLETSRLPLLFVRPGA